MNKVYGLTGGIASGKSTVAGMLRARGLTVIDADQIARDVVAPGTPGLDAVIDRFGGRFLGPDGLDRAALSELVFTDPAARRDLDAILHPLIAAESARRIGRALQESDGPVFYDAALLVESGLAGTFAGLVVVACSEQTQVDRIARRDGVDEDTARRRIAAQLPLADKIAVADRVLWNDGSIGELEQQVASLVRELDPR